MARLEELMAKLRAEATGCYSWSNGPRDRYAAHSHAYEKVLYCVDGSITFTLDAGHEALAPSIRRWSATMAARASRAGASPSPAAWTRSCAA
jgi:hypothetical protein